MTASDALLFGALLFVVGLFLGFGLAGLWIMWRLGRAVRKIRR